MSIFCPVCLDKAGSYNVEIDKFNIYKCPNCGLEYTNPIPTDKELEEFYSDYFDIRADSTIVKLNAQNNLNRLCEYGISEESTILDFGCGKGEFVEITGDNCFGIELGKVSAPRIYGKLEDLPVKEFDSITMWGVLEHINDIRNITKDVVKLLKKGGYLFITTVDAEGVIPYYYKPPEHLTYWTKNSFKILAEHLDCEIKTILPCSMKQFSNIYLDRLLSRTPKEYTQEIAVCSDKLPDIVTVPTNEVFVVLKKR